MKSVVFQRENVAYKIVKVSCAGSLMEAQMKTLKLKEELESHADKTDGFRPGLHVDRYF